MTYSQIILNIRAQRRSEQVRNAGIRQLLAERRITAGRSSS
jgi:hypothetical protein